MKENEWRNKLVRSFKKAYSNNGFIWVNDVRYKAGYPDLYVICHGISRHYELKIYKEETSEPSRLVDLMTKLQQAVCSQIANAGIYCSLLVYMPNLRVGPRVYAYSFMTKIGHFLNMSEFEDAWFNGTPL